MEIWNAILPLLGVAMGAMLQHLFSRSAEVRKQLVLLRGQAHVDYLKAVARSAQANSQEARRVAVADAADAKARIAIFGTSRVVRALAEFERVGPRLDNAASDALFLALVSTMRETENDVALDDLHLVLLGPRPMSND